MDFVKDQLTEQVTALRGLWKNKRQLTFSVLNLAMIVFSALMMWKGLMVVTKSESPVVVVLSGSMEPAFYRGDILILDNTPTHMEVGDIVVFKIAGRDVPIVHRILRRHARGSLSGRDSSNSSALLPPSGRLGDGVEVDYLTKGDNNNIDDRNLYATGQLWLSRQEIVGKAVAFCPYVGMVTILLNDYPALKYALVGLMGLFVITGKET